MEEFCSLLAYILVQTDSSWIEMESEFIWGLIHPCMLAGEGGYYLTMLSSTIHFIKNIDQQQQQQTADDGGATAAIAGELPAVAVAAESALCGKSKTKTVGKVSQER